jgi:hypothetical protein
VRAFPISWKRSRFQLIGNRSNGDQVSASSSLSARVRAL